MNFVLAHEHVRIQLNALAHFKMGTTRENIGNEQQIFHLSAKFAEILIIKLPAARSLD